MFHISDKKVPQIKPLIKELQKVRWYNIFFCIAVVIFLCKCSNNTFKKLAAMSFLKVKSYSSNSKQFTLQFVTV